MTPSTAVTSLNSSARSKDVEDVGTKTSLLQTLLGTTGSAGGGNEAAAVTWYGSRDVEVGRPANVRYVSLRRCARQSSSVDSESGAATPTSKKLTPSFPKRFGFVGWTRTATPPPPGESLRHQSSGDVGEDHWKRPDLDGHSSDFRYRVRVSRRTGSGYSYVTR